jgi:hypothetical protein
MYCTGLLDYWTVLILSDFRDVRMQGQLALPASSPLAAVCTRLVSERFPLYVHTPPCKIHAVCIYAVSYREGCAHVNAKCVWRKGLLLAWQRSRQRHHGNG